MNIRSLERGTSINTTLLGIVPERVTGGLSDHLMHVAIVTSVLLVTWVTIDLMLELAPNMVWPSPSVFKRGMTMQKIKINGNEYLASIDGLTRDTAWGGRASKSITLAMDYETAMATFVDNILWSILYQGPDYYDPELQQTVTPPAEEYDNSDYCMAGDVTDHRDGTVTVKMGKPTAEELNQILMEAMTR